MNVVERFLKYVSYDTESDPTSTTSPSSAKQMILGEELVKEMKELGIQDAYMNEYGIVYGSIPSNTKDTIPTIGFIAHMDTSPDLTGKDVSPRIIEDYDGCDIILNKEKNIMMSTKDFPSLKTNIHQDIIVTDGTTLLGADDKAGVAEIMAMADQLLHSKIKHGTIKIAFTSDEEVGRGTDHFDVQAFGADYAYTVDGGELESVDYENFHAASAVITIHGKSIHPGSAKHKMINSLLIAMEFQQMLPLFDNPAYTEGYEGFNHLIEMEGCCETTTMQYIIRNHDDDIFDKQKLTFKKIASYLNDKYGEHTIDLKLEDSYANMRVMLEKDMHVVEAAKQAINDIGYTPKSTAIRGGTDGARLTYDGLPCPNLGTGGYNYHGKYEYVSITIMKEVVKMLLKIIENSTQQG